MQKKVGPTKIGIKYYVMATHSNVRRVDGLFSGFWIKRDQLCGQHICAHCHEENTLAAFFGDLLSASKICCKHLRQHSNNSMFMLNYVDWATSVSPAICFFESRTFCFSNVHSVLSLVFGHCWHLKSAQNATGVFTCHLEWKIGPYRPHRSSLIKCNNRALKGIFSASIKVPMVDNY